MSQKKTNIFYTVLVRVVSGDYNLKSMILSNWLRMRHTGHIAMRWQGSRKWLVIWWQMIVIRGLLPHGRKFDREI